MPTENRTKTPDKWLAVACLLLLLGVAVCFLHRPKSAAVVHPRQVSITETIAQLSGTMEHLLVKVGDRVKSVRVVVADEPTGNLDSRSGDEVFNIMRERNREEGTAFILVTTAIASPSRRIASRRSTTTGYKKETSAHLMILLSSLSDS